MLDNRPSRERHRDQMTLYLITRAMRRWFQHVEETRPRSRQQTGAMRGAGAGRGQ